MLGSPATFSCRNRQKIHEPYSEFPSPPRSSGEAGLLSGLQKRRKLTLSSMSG
jgi:hypothetical protein